MKIKNVTPMSFSCIGGGCPAIYETDRGTYLIVGSKVDFPDNVLPGKVGRDETVIEVPIDLIRGVTLNKGDKS